ncbi:PREDICTED: myelin transcription factor 1-like protein [Camelina sativa]|uniref:Myelin transcription factor 1-like protein n=1 Tax=Camelina sativa TaxID=90675 RepID=A0ABM0X4T9_CAMSA|nr:PREDICTED: myelin transcription factor 1-like protein [Camelina sativa]
MDTWNDKKDSMDPNDGNKYELRSQSDHIRKLLKMCCRDTLANDVDDLDDTDSDDVDSDVSKNEYDDGNCSDEDYCEEEEDKEDEGFCEILYVDKEDSEGDDEDDTDDTEDDEYDSETSEDAETEEEEYKKQVSSPKGNETREYSMYHRISFDLRDSSGMLLRCELTGIAADDFYKTYKDSIGESLICVIRWGDEAIDIVKKVFQKSRDESQKETSKRFTAIIDMVKEHMKKKEESTELTCQLETVDAQLTLMNDILEGRIDLIEECKRLEDVRDILEKDVKDCVVPEIHWDKLRIPFNG